MLKTLPCALVALAFGLAALRQALPDAAMIVCGDVINLILRARWLHCPPFPCRP